MQRLDAVSRSPLYAHFSETLAGVETIRAYGAVQRFALSNQGKVDYNHRCVDLDNLLVDMYFVFDSSVLTDAHSSQGLLQPAHRRRVAVHPPRPGGRVHHLYGCPAGGRSPLEVTRNTASIRFDQLAHPCSPLLTAQVINRESRAAGILALTLTESLEVTAFLKYAVRAAAMFESRFNSVERLLAYVHLQQEAPAHVPDHTYARC